MTKTSRKLAQTDWKKRRDRIIEVLNKYKGPSTAGTGYFIWFNGHSFPPKEIRSLVEGQAKNTFSGGGKTNQMFRDLGFAVIKGRDKLPTYANPRKHEVGIHKQVSDVSRYVKDFFHESWKPLDDQLDSGGLSDVPGVYALAYSHESRAGKPVERQEIIYVGMSTTSLSTRLQQFWDGIHDGGHHSGAMTFYNRWAGRTPFNKLPSRGKFWVAIFPIGCETRKGLRTPCDLEKHGLVVALEYYVLADIKREIGLEPPLNKK